MVGVHSDEQIEINKGPTVMKQQERYDAVRACRWVDEVVEDAPYFTMLDVLDKYNCDFCVHGDDITTMADGSDCYQAVKDAGRYKECKRTQGISTTDLLNRMLQIKDGSQTLDYLKPSPEYLRYVASILAQFQPSTEPSLNDTIVYVDGAFDMFHPGHIEFLKAAKQHGSFLVVGVYGDETVLQTKQSYPIMNVWERSLGVLSCRFVDSIVRDAPSSPSASFLDSHKVNLVVDAPLGSPDERYSAAIQTGRYLKIVTSQHVSTEAIVKRILDNHALYVERNRRKEAKSQLEAAMK